MTYTFQCEKCNKQEEINIPMSEYDEEKDNQFCVHCGAKLKRVLEFNGTVNLCYGCYGVNQSKSNWTN